MLTIVQPRHRRHSRHLLHLPNIGNARRPAHRLLLHAIHPRRGEPPLLTHLAQCRGADEEINCPCYNLHRVGCWKCYRAAGTLYPPRPTHPLPFTGHPQPHFQAPLLNTILLGV
jgi:hypothetical protein